MSSEPHVPEVVLRAQRLRRHNLVRHVLPATLWLLALVPLLLVIPDFVEGGAGQMALFGLWLLGISVGLGYLMGGVARMLPASLVLSAWNQQKVAMGVAEGARQDASQGADPADELVQGIVSLLGPEVQPVVQACRDRSRALKAEAERARAALAGLPPEGQGAKALAEAAQQAEQRALQLDDELASLYAQAMSSSVDRRADVADAFDRLRALAEVDTAKDSASSEQALRRATAARVRELG